VNAVRFAGGFKCAQHFDRGAIEPRHRRNSRVQSRLFQPILFNAVERTPVPIGLVRRRTSSACAPTFRHTRFGSTRPGDRVSKLDVFVTDRVAADYAALCFRHFVQATADDLLEDRGVPFFRETDERQRRDRAATHRVHIAQRVGRGNLSEGKRIVDDRREKIDGLHQRQSVAQQIHPGIVVGVETNEYVGSVGNGRRRSIESSVPGLSFAAQPAALTMAVSFTESVKPHLALLRFDYNDAAGFLLGTHGTYGH
jgi:hypothetical protein